VSGIAGPTKGSTMSGSDEIKTHRCYVNGQWVEPVDAMDVTNPSTGEFFARIATSTSPFGGMKQSGWGRELGVEGLDAYMETKHISMGLGI